MISGAGTAQLHVPKAAELLAAEIRGQIVRRELREGDTLPSESELMQRFGVSRPTLREALRVLEMESLLRIRRGSRGGAVVTLPDPAVAARGVGIILQLRGVSLGDLHGARTMIEPIAARYIAQSRDSDDVITELRRINDQAREAVEDFDRFPHCTWSFHRSLVEGANNRTVGVLIQLIADIIELAISRKYSRQMTEAEAQEQTILNKRSVKANDRLIKLLEARDGDGAEAYWTRHLNAVAESLVGADRDVGIDLPI